MVSALKGTESKLGKQLASDMTGAGSYIDWIAAIVIIGMIGYVPNLETASRALLGLILLGFLVSNKGVFTQFQQALSGNVDVSGGSDKTAEQQSPLTGPAPISITNSGGGSNPLGTLTKAFGSGSSSAGNVDVGGGGDFTPAVDTGGL